MAPTDALQIIADITLIVNKIQYHAASYYIKKRRSNHEIFGGSQDFSSAKVPANFYSLQHPSQRLIINSSAKEQQMNIFIDGS